MPNRWEIEEEYYSAGKDKRRSKNDTPWALIILLGLAISGAVVTRRHSLEDENQQPARTLIEEPVEEVDIASVYRQDAEIEALAAKNFNPDFHALYADLPPLPTLTEEQEHGGWKYTPAVYDYAAHHPAAEVVSWDKPRAIVFKSFLTPQEVGHLIAVAKDKLERSHVLASDENDSEAVLDVRTSYGTWPPWDEVIGGITERIHRLLGIPMQFGEDIYILNYQQGQKYDAHNDNCVELHDTEEKSTLDPGCVGFLKRAGGPDCGPGAGGDSCGDRIATFILNLAAPAKGGRTVFPTAEITNERTAAAGVPRDGGHEWYCEHDEVLGVTPQPGDATLFYDYRPATGAGLGSWANNTAEPAALPVPEGLHSGCPVLEGEKYIATRWIRSARFI